MGDVKCSKCTEPWDLYGVRNGDMEPGEAARFLRGEGCPGCGFGAHCPLCAGTGRYEDYRSGCRSCRGKGYALAWVPSRSGPGYRVGMYHVGYVPNIQIVTPPEGKLTIGTRVLPERVGSHLTADGSVTEWWIPCPEGCAATSAEPCPSCSGTGELTPGSAPTMGAALRTVVDLSSRLPEDISGLPYRDPVGASEDASLDAARSECDESDEDPMEILIRRGIL